MPFVTLIDPWSVILHGCQPLSNDEASDYDGTDTDWLANCAYCYGFGYTAQQALSELAANLERDLDPDDDLTVELVEHVGNATVKMGGGWEVDTFVSGHRVEIPVERIGALKEAQLRVIGIRSHLDEKHRVGEYQKNDDGWLEFVEDDADSE